ARRARTSKREIEYEYLISSAPLDSLLKMCGFRFDDSIFTCNKVLVFNLGFSEKGPKGVHWIYFPQRELSFYRVGFYDNIFDSDRMSLYVEVGYPRNELLDDSKISQARQRVLSDLRSTGIRKGQELLEHAHVVLDPAYVHITERSNREVAEYKHLLAALGVYSTGRYGSWTYCSIEDNIKEARALADRFNRLSAEIP
ncbi:MAG: LPS biosynthesis protein, partial [Myxococcota bacterium]